jgi:hypothetical protein
LKYFIIIVLIDLLYLNFCVPLTLSIEQVLLIAFEVVRICYKKGIDVPTLSPDQLDEIVTLSITSAKQVFKENGFRFIPNIISPK